jgi:hypothetical protein
MSGYLVPVVAVERDISGSPAAPVARASANFVAHLIAMRGQAPQTRTRRRTDPAEAINAYDALGHWPTRSGRAVSRSL